MEKRHANFESPLLQPDKEALCAMFKLWNETKNAISTTQIHIESEICVRSSPINHEVPSC